MLIPKIKAMEKQIMTMEKKLVLNDLLGFKNLELSNQKTLSDQENSKEDLLFETISKNHNKIGEVAPESLLEVISKNHNKIGEVGVDSLLEAISKNHNKIGETDLIEV